MFFTSGPVYALTLGYFNGGPVISDSRQADDLAAYLSSHLDTEITVKRLAHDLDMLKAFNSGRIDLAVLPDYLLSAAKHGEPLATPITLDDKRNFKLYLLVAKNNSAEKIQDLQGSILARQYSLQREVDLFIGNLTGQSSKSYFKRVKGTATIEETAAMAGNGEAEAICLSSGSLQIIKKLSPGLARRLKIIQSSPVYANHPFVGQKTIAHPLKQSLAMILIEMSRDYAAAQILMGMGIKGFGPPITEPDLYPHFKKLALEQPEPAKISPKKVKQPIKPKEKIKTVISAPAAPAPKENKTGKPSTAKKTAKKKDVQPKSTVKQKKPAKPIRQESAAAKPLIPPKLADSATSFTADYDFFAMLTESEPGIEVKKPPPGPGKEAKIPSAKMTNPPQPELAEGKLFWLPLALKVIFSLLLLSLAAYAYVFLRAWLLGEKTIVMLQAGGKVHAISCQSKKLNLHVKKYLSGNSEKVSLEQLLPDMLSDFGYRSGSCKIVTILSSSKTIFQQITMPILKKEEIASALPWQVKEKKINFSLEDDNLQFSVRSTDKKKNEMIIDVIIFPQNEYLLEWQALGESSDRSTNLECSLFHSFCCTIKNFTPQDIAFVYQVDAEQAIIFLLGGREGVVSRRLFTAAGFDIDDKESNDVELWWPGFFTDMEQTFRYYHQQNGRSIATLYLAGQGITGLEEHSATLAEKLEVEVSGVNLLKQVKLENFTPEELGWIELMTGAAYPCGEI